MPDETTQEARRETVEHWLSSPFEWRIPVYQRHYAWNPKEEFGPTQLFWEIVEERAKKRLEGKKIPPHYFGAILVELKKENLNPIQKYDVVDGQQRLTTINVAIFAIIKLAGQLGIDYHQEMQGKLAKYIFNTPSAEDARTPKLIPTNYDRTRFSNLLSDTYEYDMEQTDYPNNNQQEGKSKVVEARDFFNEKFQDFVNENGSDDETKKAAIQALSDVILKEFELILIPLKETDEAQKVFESLNNTAKPLTTFDLIRNDIFYRADKDVPGSDVKLFNSDKWQQFEDTFWENPSSKRSEISHIEAYIARMLMTKKKEIITQKREIIFREYKSFAKAEKENGLGVREEIATISEYVNIYKYLVGGIKKNPLSTDNFIFDFGYFMYKNSQSLDFYPVIFAIANSKAPVEEKQKMIFLLENYVIRRRVANLTTKHYNRQAIEICSELGNSPSYQKLNNYLKEGSVSTRQFPSNGEITKACVYNDLYSERNLIKYMFNCMAYHTTDKSAETRDIKGLSIDHIMPQAWDKKDGWKEINKGFKEDEINLMINTIGNLTPMSGKRNKQKSNHEWLGTKGAREKIAGCDLKLTRKIAYIDYERDKETKKEKWDMNDIETRSRELAKIICEIWDEDGSL